jgi:hypothetical protein
LLALTLQLAVLAREPAKGIYQIGVIASCDLPHSYSLDRPFVLLIRAVLSAFFFCWGPANRLPDSAGRFNSRLLSSCIGIVGQWRDGIRAAKSFFSCINVMVRQRQA